MEVGKILITLDPSEIAIQSAKKALEIAMKFKAEVAVAHVLETFHALGSPELGMIPIEANEQMRKDAQDLLNDFAKHAKGITVKTLLLEGSPREEIINAAKAFHADMIMCGTHGRTGLMHMLMGSFAESLVQHSPIPVMVIPAKALKK